MKMETQNSGNFSRASIIRIVVYASAILLLYLGVVRQIGRIQESRSSEIINFYDEWRAHGKPVAVKKVVRTEFGICDRITAVAVSKHLLEAYVSRALMNRIKPGQPLCRETQGDEFKGSVVSVSGEPDINTGLFKISLEISGSDKSLGSSYRLSVQTSKIRNVIKVPMEALQDEGESAYLWVLEGGNVKKRYVKPALSDGLYVVIEKGLDAGDLIVVSGANALIESDRVRVSGFTEP